MRQWIIEANSLSSALAREARGSRRCPYRRSEQRERNASLPSAARYLRFGS
jgi:hypothetical protein